MDWSAVAGRISEQLEKAREFRYFAMLAIFIFFLDAVLVIFHSDSVLQLRYANLSDNYQLGQVLLFLTMFTFFLSFLVPLTQVFLRFLSTLVPSRISYFFYYDEWKDIKAENFCYLDQVKRYAVKNNNSVAYDYYKSVYAARKESDQLNYLCLALLLAVSFDAYAWLNNGSALFSFFVPFFNDEDMSFTELLVGLPLWMLIAGCFYYGVIKDGRFSWSSTNKVFFPNNDFKDF